MPEAEEYHGSFVILRPDRMGFIVTVEPPLPDGEDRTRTYAEKHSAWGFARELWCELRLPFRDESDVRTTLDNARKE
jgi:hypothetical protein